MTTTTETSEKALRREIQSRNYRIAKLSPGVSLNSARSEAQRLANEWDETVCLLERFGAGKARYAPGMAVYHPEAKR